MTTPAITAAADDWPRCEAQGCAHPADWAYIGEGGDLYVCAVHGGTEPAEGWQWIRDQRW